MKKRIFISACEQSADNHCANLIKAVKQNYPDMDIEWTGLGGESMTQTGCQLLQNTVSRAAMIYNAFGQVGFYYILLRRVSSYFKANKIDLVIVCDSPAFNFHVAKAAKKAGIKVMFYVAPQLWAWASWRIRKLRKRCDKLACILPFEEEWFTNQGVDAAFVGNPLFDDLSIEVKDTGKDYSAFEPENCTIALMPGSRDAEIKTLWPAMQKIALMLQQRFTNLQFVVSASDSSKLQTLKETQLEVLNCKYVIDDVAGAASIADLTLVASGSATLQVAAAASPMIVMYQSSRFMWHLLGRWLIKTKHLTLVNILANRELITEFMPYFTSIEPICQKCLELLEDKKALTAVSTQLTELAKPLAKEKASNKVAAIAVEMITQK